MSDTNKNNPTTTPSPTTTPTEKPKASWFKRLLRKITIFFVIFLLLVIGGCYAYFTIPVKSDADKIGIITNCYTSGFLFKTYEGELNEGGTNSSLNNTVVNNTWKFSVKNNSIYTDLKNLQGKNVKLHYTEYKIRLFWRGDTQYIIDGVEEVQ